jgi:hypothetical protein
VNTLAWTLALIVAYNGGSDAVVRDADRLEINHLYAEDDAAKTGVSLRFTQLIWWQYHAVEKRFVVVEWRMLKSAWPERSGAFWVVRWMDKGRLVEIRAKTAVETWTLEDPEQVDKDRYGSLYRWGVGSSQ